MGPGFESQRDHQETLKPLDNQGVLFFKVLNSQNVYIGEYGSSQKVGD